MVCDSQYSANSQFRGNTVKVEAMTDDLDFGNAGYCFACVDFTGGGEPAWSYEVLLADNRSTPYISTICSRTDASAIQN